MFSSYIWYELWQFIVVSYSSPYLLIIGVSYCLSVVGRNRNVLILLVTIKKNFQKLPKSTLDVQKLEFINSLLMLLLLLSNGLSTIYLKFSNAYIANLMYVTIFYGYMKQLCVGRCWIIKSGDIEENPVLKRNSCWSLSFSICHRNLNSLVDLWRFHFEQPIFVLIRLISYYV